MEKVKTAMEQHEDSLVQIGRDQGLFEMAIKIKHEYGLEAALEMSEFSAEELENEKLKYTLENNPFKHLKS